jgi:hypothetical protein
MYQLEKPSVPGEEGRKLKEEALAITLREMPAQASG